MTMRILIAAAALAMVVGLSAPAAAQGCQRSRAPAITFAEATRSDTPSTRCVEIEGVVVGRVLVEDDRARYRRERTANDPSSTGAILGFYSDTDFDVPTRVRVVGRLSDCASIDAAAQARAGDDIVMLTGFCHYYRGRTVTAVHVEPLGPVTFRRMLPGQASAGADLGNLSPLADGDTRRQMRAAADRYLGAIRTGDRAALAAMHGGGAGGQRDRGDLDRVLGIMLDDAAAPFAALRTGDAVQIELFGWKPPLWADAEWRAEAGRTGATDAIACFSTRADAAALWPIDSKDADNVPGRPYACTRIHIASTGADAPASFDTDQADQGVAEPDR